MVRKAYQFRMWSQNKETCTIYPLLWSQKYPTPSNVITFIIEHSFIVITLHSLHVSYNIHAFAFMHVHNSRFISHWNISWAKQNKAKTFIRTKVNMRCKGVYSRETAFHVFRPIKNGSPYLFYFCSHLFFCWSVMRIYTL